MSRHAALFNQDRVWVGVDGIQCLDEMDRHHRANLIPFLRGNARTFHFAVTGTEITAAEAEEWLERTPLMRRLVELEGGRPIDDRRATHERNRTYEQETGYQKVRLG